MAETTRPIGAVSGEGHPPPLELRLYIAAAAPNSTIAESNLRALLATSGAESSLEIIDCLSEPLRALQDGVLVTPTLLKVSPKPEQTIIGTLSDRTKLAAALGLEADLIRNGTYD